MSSVERPSTTGENKSVSTSFFPCVVVPPGVQFDYGPKTYWHRLKWEVLIGCLDFVEFGDLLVKLGIWEVKLSGPFMRSLFIM